MSPTSVRCSARSPRTAPSWCCTAPPGPTSTARSRIPTARWRVNEYGSRHVARAARACRGRAGRVLDRLRVRRATIPRATTSARRSRRAASTAPPSSRASVRSLTEHPEAYVVRTAWVFSPRGHNFLLTMLRLGAEREEMRVVDDQVGCPTATAHLARATLELVERCPPGIYHLAGGGSTSWCGFASAIMQEAGLARARRADLRPASCSARRRGRPARSCEPCTPTLRGCHTGETGCAIVSLPWPTRRERETHPRDRRLRVHRLAFRAAPARRHDDVEVVNLDALTYAGNPANLADVADGRALSLRARLDLRRRRRRARRRGLRRDRQLRRRDARRPLHHGGRRLHPDRRLRHVPPAGVDPRARRPPRARLDRRGLRRHRGRATPRARTTPCGPARRTPPRRPAATCRCSRPCAPTASTP